MCLWPRCTPWLFSGPNCWLGTVPEQDISSWVNLKCPFNVGVHGVMGDAASPSVVQGGSPWSLPLPQVQGGTLQQCHICLLRAVCRKRVLGG